MARCGGARRCAGAIRDLPAGGNGTCVDGGPNQQQKSEDSRAKNWASFERAEKTALRCLLIGHLCGDIDLVHDENREGTVWTRCLLGVAQILLRSLNAALPVIPVVSVDATS
jgi:hypothetical protein